MADVLAVSGFDDATSSAGENEEHEASAVAADRPPPRRSFFSARHVALIVVGAVLVALAGRALLLWLLPPASLPVPPLQLALPPEFAPTQISEDLQPFLDYLKRRVGRSVRIVIDRDHATLRRQLAQGQLDLAMLPHFQVVLARKEAPGLRMIAALSYKGATHYSSVIVTRDNSGIREIGDLLGKRICWSHPASASGFLVPRHYLRSKQLDPDDMLTSHLSGSHLAAIKDVVDGRCEAAATNEGWLVLGGTRDVATSRLRVLAKTGNIPLDVICASARLPVSLVKKLRRALLEFQPRRDIGRDVLSPHFLADGFGEPPLKGFQTIEEAIRQEGISL